ncbi:MAG: F0F1 ATP synthase subunit gamma [Candidatus Omnitrophota bacterium]
MIPVAKIKKDLEYSGNLKEVIDILKLISSSEFGRITSAAPGEDNLKKHVIDSLGMLKNVGANNVFFTERKHLPRCYVLVCSDEGFLGEMNNRVIGLALSHSSGSKTKFIVLGERGAELLNDPDNEPTVFPAVSSDVKTSEIMDVTNHIFGMYKRGEVGSVHIVYMHFHSFTSHKTEALRLLPCDDMLEHIGKKKEAEETIVEPNISAVINYLVKVWLENSIQNVFWSSKQAEWAIRIMRLENSSEELKDMTESLRFKYFKSVHALSDKVIREIFAAKAITWK